MMLKPKSFVNYIICIGLGVLGLGGLANFLFFYHFNVEFFKRYEIIAVTFSAVCLVLFIVKLITYIRKLKTRWSKIRYVFISLFSVIICFYITFCALVYIFQNEIISKNNLIFQPSRISKETSDLYAEDSVEKLNIAVSDTIELNGWLVKNSLGKKLPLVIYFGGSGEEVSDMIEYAKQLDGWSVALVNYRGFGTSQGSPNQNAVFHDALIIYDKLSKRPDIDNKRIVTMGWSLGTAVSVYLSDNRPIKATILISPMDSITNILQSRIPYIPLRMLLKQSFNSISRAPYINNPLLCLIGDYDMNVSPKSSMKLADKWKGKHSVRVYKDEDHSLLFHTNNSLIDIKNFLKKQK